MGIELKSTDEVFAEIKGFATELFELQLRKKEIDEEIKEMKQNWKEEGVAVGKVAKVLNQIKARAKMNEADQLEEDIIFEKLEADKDIQDNIARLNS